jgi:hypothetical protein
MMLKLLGALTVTIGYLPDMLMKWNCCALFVLLIMLSALQPGACAEEIDLSHCMVKSEVHRSSAFPDPSYDEMRARALVAAGHVEESIPWFLKVLSDEQSRLSLPPYKTFLQRDLAQAYEKLGRLDDAKKYYTTDDLYYGGKDYAAFLIRQGLFSTAKDVCDRAISEQRARKAKYRYAGYDDELCAWLQLRASAARGLHADSIALDDLKEAAFCYAQDNSILLDKCIKEANEIMKRSSGKQDFKVTIGDLPAEGKQSVLRLLAFLNDSPTPVTVDAINKRTGAKLRVPGGAFPDCDQSDRPSPPFWQVEYRTTRNYDPASALIRIIVWTDRCAIDKATIVDALSQHRSDARNTYDWFNEMPLSDAEVWKSPSGTLVLRFGRSGFQVLKSIEWRGAETRSGTGDTAIDLSRLSARAQAEGNLQQAIEYSSQAIRIEPTNAFRYMERAKLYARQTLFAKAVADCAEAVKLGGLMYLPDKVDCLIKDGRSDEAVRELNEAIASSKFERERSLLHLLLAKLYLDRKDFSAAITSADSCIVAEEKPDYKREDGASAYIREGAFSELERMSAPAHVIKAKSEAALGRMADARRDAAIAAQEFFDIARIECRDKVLAWLKSLPDL